MSWSFGYILFAILADDAWVEPPAEPAEAFAPAAEDQEPWLSTRVTGYADLRLGGSAVDVGGILPTRDTPWFTTLLEANSQLRLRWREVAFLSADLSLVYQRGALFFRQDELGQRRQVADHDVASLRPFVSLSELYASYNLHEHLNVTLGKQRIVWGSGFALNPTDLLNPPKDPTDPTFQRAGAWLAKIEAPFPSFTVTLLGAAQVTRSASGIPTAFLTYPEAPPYESLLAPAAFPYRRDDEPHGLLAARFYTLQWNTDVNVFYTFTNLYNDVLRNQHRFGLSLSRYVTDTLELHAEALGQLASSRLYVDDACVADSLALASCLLRGVAPATYHKRNDGLFRAKVVAGARLTFDDEAMLSAEYYYSGDGYSRAESASYIQALRLIGAMDPSLQSTAQASLLGGGAPRDPGVPQKFTFDPLRQHYLFLSYMKPRIADDFTLNAVLILSLHDFSGQFAPSLAYSTTEWLTLTLYGFFTLPGVDSLAAGGEPELALTPVDWRVLFSARAFY